MPVIDASVYVTLLNAHEQAHTRSWTWFEGAKASQEPIVAPTIILPEVAVAISRGAGDSDMARQVVEQLKGSGVIELHPVTQPLAELAAEIAAGSRIRGCDALYAALAHQIGGELVTLDRQQLERAAGHVKVREP